jgi:hypothetical protein
MDTDDDLSIVRNILHINMSICLLIAQLFFFFSINQMKYQVKFSFSFRKSYHIVFYLSLLVE